MRLSDALLISDLPYEIAFSYPGTDDDLETGTDLVSFTFPYGFEIYSTYASVSTAPAGSDIIVDINVDDSSIYTTNLLHIDDGDTTSYGSSTTPNITTTTVPAGQVMTVDIDQVGSGTAGKQIIVGVIGKRIAP